MGPEAKQQSEKEPWMRGTHGELDPLRRGVVHALELAAEDGERWCGGMRTEAIHRRVESLPSVAFHLRHLVRSLDRLLTYAEDRGLDEGQRAALATEMDPGEPAGKVMREFREGLGLAMERVRAFQPEAYGEARGIGRQRLPTTVGGLLVHCAEHTGRHIGQAVTTAKLVGGGRDG